ncbi:MAG: Nif3-like dinuclear metal center hexameric protein [Candidatus Auribacterota bacterium]
MELLSTIQSYLDEELKIKDIDDYCVNGLEVDGREEICKIAFMVDASEQGFQQAVSSQADMIIVHHGLVFGSITRITGMIYRRLKILIKHGISLYAAHIPLDVHAELGNNIQLAQLLNLVNIEQFTVGKYKDLLVIGELQHSQSLDLFVSTIKTRIHPNPRTLHFASDTVSKVAIISGSGSEAVELAALNGADIFLTGESKLSAYHVAREAGINMVFAGHYFTETVGLKALMKKLESLFNVNCEFIDIPTEL